jgi:hypothetical protein
MALDCLSDYAAQNVPGQMHMLLVAVIIKNVEHVTESSVPNV